MLKKKKKFKFTRSKIQYRCAVDELDALRKCIHEEMYGCGEDNAFTEAETIVSVMEYVTAPKELRFKFVSLCSDINALIAKIEDAFDPDEEG